jgi:uroporphyrinogen decarboxylase
VAIGAVMPQVATERLRESALLLACRREAAPRVPIWLMRQAGRYLPEYRALRERHSMEDLIANPELAVEVTLQPLRRFDLDAAIIFTDLLPPLAGMGLTIGWANGSAPRVATPLSRPRDIDMLAAPPAAEILAPTLRATALASAELAGSGRPLIGFCGAPFTLASYAIEGGTSRAFTKTKALMYGHPAAWSRLMARLVTVLADYLVEQARAGAAALQVFDSWAGVALGRDDYVRYVQPWNRKLFEACRPAGVPVISFSTGTAAYIEDVAAGGGDVAGVDWRMPMEFFRQRLGPGAGIQGNLDPAALLGPWREIAPRVDAILASGPEHGHIFNLGHGILPETEVDTVARLVDHVHAWKRNGS